ncbi:MAG: RES domain-containing protein [Actinomycetota bacterium]|nr:RES domain-containing protein [Actinomycetota bacterium]
MSGRFDLQVPEGTCYLASTDEAAARERIGPLLRKIAGHESVLASVLVTSEGPVVVTEVTLGTVHAANLPVRKADRWINRSLWAGTGIYWIAQGWAALWRAADFEGLLYEPRFTGGARVRALALFGAQGRPKPAMPIDGSKSLEEVLIAHGVRLVWPPGSAPALSPMAAPPSL